MKARYIGPVWVFDVEPQTYIKFRCWDCQQDTPYSRKWLVGKDFICELCAEARDESCEDEWPEISTSELFFGDIIAEAQHLGPVSHIREVHYGYRVHFWSGDSDGFGAQKVKVIRGNL